MLKNEIIFQLNKKNHKEKICKKQQAYKMIIL